jgi:hypothetical protein
MLPAGLSALTHTLDFGLCSLDAALSSDIDRML